MSHEVDPARCSHHGFRLPFLAVHTTVSGTRLTMSERQVLDQRLDVVHSESAQRHEDSDDEPMVYVTPKDYATSARLWRDHLIAKGGISPIEAIF